MKQVYLGQAGSDTLVRRTSLQPFLGVCVRATSRHPGGICQSKATSCP